uniref:(northern house mosquito) hypothetical protein n=1 Tax=Culex pipiens TaxID=7175 RepID=A0A8D8E502_CULPI
MNFHSIPRRDASLVISVITLVSRSSSYSSRRWLLAPWKLRPLSEWISDGRPRRETKRRRAARNAAVVKSPTSSRWTAFVLKHTKTAMYAFCAAARRCTGFR